MGLSCLSLNGRCWMGYKSEEALSGRDTSTKGIFKRSE